MRNTTTNPITILKRDERNRISLTKLGKHLPLYFKAIITEDNRIILEPVDESQKEVHWLLKPENKHLLEEFEQGLKQASEGKFVAWSDIKHKYEV